MLNYYKILQVDPIADQAVIKSAYRTLMLRLKKHPDHGGGKNDAQKINEAYKILKDPSNRRQYDKNNYHNLNARNDNSPRYYYVRCYFCSSINRIDLKKSSLQPKAITCGKCHSPFFTDTLDMHKMRNHKRKGKRYKCTFKMTIQLEFGGERFQGKCIDLSNNGMRFLSDLKMSTGQIVKISFSHDKKFIAIAKILRTKKNSTTSFDYAVSYIEAKYEKA